MNMQMTEEEYVAKGGGVCPFCSSDHIEGLGTEDFQGNQAFFRVICRDCDAKWDDVYTLTGLNPINRED